MDVIAIPKELDQLDEICGKLQIIAESTGVQLNCHGSNIYVTPPSANARRMVESLFRMSIIALSASVSALVEFNGPISVPIRQEIEKCCIDADVNFVFKKKGVQIEGNRRKVEEAKTLLNFLNSFSSKEITSPSPDGSAGCGGEVRDEFGRFSCEGTPKSKPKRRFHTCPFCKKEMSSSSFRSHVVEHCKNSRFTIANENQRNKLVDKYYKIRGLKDNVTLTDLENSDDEVISRYPDEVCTSNPEIVSHEEKNVDQQRNDKIVLGELESVGVEAALEGYEAYGSSSFSGKKMVHSASTKNKKMSVLRKLINLGRIKEISKFCGKSMDAVMMVIESLPYDSYYKYAVIEAIIDLLKYLKLEWPLTQAGKYCLESSIERWDRGRACFQAKLMKDRQIKKKKILTRWSVDCIPR